MRFITFLRRLDNHKKDRIILIGSICLTLFIAIGGFLFTRSSFYLDMRAGDEISATSTIDTLVSDIQTTIVPTFKDIQENISTVSEEYKKGSFKDFFVPKSE